MMDKKGMHKMPDGKMMSDKEMTEMMAKNKGMRRQVMMARAKKK